MNPPVVDLENRLVILSSDFPVPKGQKGTPGKCEHAFDWPGLMHLIMQLQEAAKQIGPDTWELPPKKVMDSKIGRF